MSCENWYDRAPVAYFKIPLGIRLEGSGKPSNRLRTGGDQTETLYQFISHYRSDMLGLK
jgi:hypothetical protein